MNTVIFTTRIPKTNSQRHLLHWSRVNTSKIIQLISAGTIPPFSYIRRRLNADEAANTITETRRPVLANVNARTSCGWILMYFACWIGHFEMLHVYCQISTRLKTIANFDQMRLVMAHTLHIVNIVLSQRSNLADHTYTILLHECRGYKATRDSNDASKQYRHRF